LKLVDGKKLVVYFGCFCEGDEPQEEDGTRTLTIEEYQKSVQAERTKIMEGFMKGEEARNVSDLYVKTPAALLFNPIVFTIHIPVSLQKVEYVLYEELRAVTEDFECVYDGNLLLIASLVEIDKIPYGVFDVRDRVKTILEKIMKIRQIPPCLYAQPVSFVTEKTQISKEAPAQYVIITKPMDSKILLRVFYDEFGDDLNEFYGLCYLSDHLDDHVEKVETQVNRLLKKMSESSLTGWKQAFRRRGFAKERRKEMVGILAGLAKYQSSLSQLKREFRDFMMLCSQSSISKLLELSDFKHYGTPTLKLDVDLMTKTVEYVRSELEGYSSNTYTLLSALAGGIIGSVITLLVRAIFRI
jgi:hypothetical protein